MVEDINKNKRMIIIARAVREVIKEMHDGQCFYGWELQQKCAAKYPEIADCYVDTCLREMRMNNKKDYKLISRCESLYMKVAKNER